MKVVETQSWWVKGGGRKEVDCFGGASQRSWWVLRDTMLSVGAEKKRGSGLVVGRDEKIESV